VFGIIRILEISLVNIQRIDKLWTSVITQELTLASQSKISLVRNSAIEAISYIVQEVFDVKVREDPYIVGEVPLETINQESDILTISTEQEIWRYP